MFHVMICHSPLMLYYDFGIILWLITIVDFGIILQFWMLIMIVPYYDFGLMADTEDARQCVRGSAGSRQGGGSGRASARGLIQLPKNIYIYIYNI